MNEGKQDSTQQATATPDIKQVVAAAAEYLKSLLGEIRGLRLEEIEENKSGLGWLVTISFRPVSEDENFLTKREYKQVETNASGKPVAMRIRKIE